MEPRLRRWTSLILAGAFALCCSEVVGRAPDGRRTVLATAGEVVVTAEEFRSEYVSFLLETGLRDEQSLRRAFLEDLVAAKLLVEELRTAGIEEEEAYRFRLEQVRRKLLLDAYAQVVLFDTLEVREQELRRLFVRAHTQVKARHLYARRREEAESLYARLQAGESFDSLAKEVFRDPTLAETGGSLGYFGFDEMDPAFEDVAFTMEVGVVSEPVRTARGYSIIQVEDRFVNPLVTEDEYARRRDNLYVYALYRKRQRARDEHVRALRDSLHIVFHERTFDQLLGQVTGSALVPDDEAFEVWLAEPLVSFGTGTDRRTWSVADFREQARLTHERQRARVRTRDDLAAFVEGLVVRDEMLRRAEALGLDETSEYARALREAMDEWTLRTARERLVAGIEVPEDSVRAYYETAPSAEFVEPARVRLHEIVVESREEAEHIKSQLERGASFSSLARIHSVRPESRSNGGDLGFLSRDQLGALADPVFEAVEGDVLGPLEVHGQFVLFLVGERLEARPMTYEEAAGVIRSQLRFAYARDRLQETYAALRAREEVAIDTELLYSMPLTAEIEN